MARRVLKRIVFPEKVFFEGVKRFFMMESDDDSITSDSSEEEMQDMMDIPVDDPDSETANALLQLREQSSNLDPSADQSLFPARFQSFVKAFFKRKDVKELMKKTNLADKKVIKYPTYSKEYIAYHFFSKGGICRSTKRLRPLHGYDVKIPQDLDFSGKKSNRV